jgi:hypothetical protein
MDAGCLTLQAQQQQQQQWQKQQQRQGLNEQEGQGRRVEMGVFRLWRVAAIRAVIRSCSCATWM